MNKPGTPFVEGEVVVVKEVGKSEVRAEKESGEEIFFDSSLVPEELQKEGTGVQWVWDDDGKNGQFVLATCFLNS